MRPFSVFDSVPSKSETVSSVTEAPILIFTSGRSRYSLDDFSVTDREQLWLSDEVMREVNKLSINSFKWLLLTWQGRRHTQGHWQCQRPPCDIGQSVEVAECHSFNRTLAEVDAVETFLSGPSTDWLCGIGQSAGFAATDSLTRLRCCNFSWGGRGGVHPMSQTAQSGKHWLTTSFL